MFIIYFGFALQHLYKMPQIIANKDMWYNSKLGKVLKGDSI